MFWAFASTISVIILCNSLTFNPIRGFKGMHGLKIDKDDVFHNVLCCVKIAIIFTISRSAKPLATSMKKIQN